MSNLKSLAKETAIYGLSSIAARFIGYLLVPIETAKFNAAGGQYGIITNIYAYIALLIIILTYGMETTFFRFMNVRARIRRKCMPRPCAWWPRHRLSSSSCSGSSSIPLLVPSAIPTILSSS